MINTLEPQPLAPVTDAELWECRTSREFELFMRGRFPLSEGEMDIFNDRWDPIYDRWYHGIDDLDTPVQNWLRNEHACVDARRFVGTESLSAAWHTATNGSWLVWLIDALLPDTGICKCSYPK